MSADRIGPKAGWHRGRSLRPSPDGGFVVPAGRPMSITDRSSGIASLELAADALTPVAAALRLGSRCAFLLESVEEGVRYGRYSFVGVHGRTLVADRDGARLLSPDGDRLLAETEPLEALQSVLPDEPDRSPELPFPLASGVGYLAYEAAARWEPIPVPEADPVGLPLAVFHLPAAVIVFDHLAQVATLAALDADGAGRLLRDVADAITRPVLDEAPLGVGAAVAPAEADPAGRARFEAGVARLVEEIRAGEMLQAVLARRFSVPTRRSPMTIHRSLRRVNPSPHLFYVDLECVAPRAALVGASPELLVRVRDGEVVTRPIAGTRPRAVEPAADAALEAELSADPKELAEHAMLVDLARNDVSRVAEPGSVDVPLLYAVERYRPVMHLVSEVRGRLRADLDAFDAVRAAFPAGTVSGAPKVRAMQAIAELEGERRGPYAGAVGFFSPHDVEAAITIRGAVIANGCATVHAGAGIVAG